MLATPVPEWERMLNQYEYHSIQAVQSRDFTIIKNLIVSRFDHFHEDRALLAEKTGDHEAEKLLDDLNVEKAETSELAVAEYQNKVNSNKDAGLDKPGWENLLDEQELIAITTVTDKIKSATAGAKNLIKTLPEDARTPAAKVYNEGSNIALQCFNILADKLKGVLGAVAEFLKGIFTKITEAYNTVKNAVSTAVNFIKNLFSFDLATNGDGSYVPPVVYIGRLNWPAAVAIGTATLALSYVTTHCMEKGGVVLEQSIKTDDKGVKTSETKLKIGGGKGRSFVPGDVFWKAAVSELGNDGHYIP